MWSWLSRGYHLAGEIGNPSWRQAETAYMALRMYEESPPQIMHAKVPYRGLKDVHVAEFPFQPFVTSLAYKLIGGENLVVARLVTFLFFLGSAWFLFLIVRRLFGCRAAWYTCVAYGLLPLSVFYSRAVHVDFCVIFWSHTFLYFGMVFYERGAWRWYAVAVLSASMAFIMKAPYCFYLGLPLAAYALLRPGGGWTFKNLATLAGVFVLPLALAWWFNDYRVVSEAHEVESVAYPHKWSHERLSAHFFGTLEHRLDPGNWKHLFKRVLFYGVTPVGGFLALMGCFVPFRKERQLGWICLLSWLAGTVLYVLVVFVIISSEHDYYTLPLLAPASDPDCALPGVPGGS